MATAPPLGTAANFAILGASTVTNTGSTSIVGSVGVSPGTSITGFPPGVISGGALHSGDGVASAAEADLVTAYGDLAAEPVDTTLSGQNLGGMTLTPGVYNFSGAAQLSGTLTLDAQGDPNAIFVIRTGTTLTTASASSIVLIDSAHAANVYWQVGSSATIGSGTRFQGNILAFTSITLDSGADMAPGRALAINGAVTMDTNANSNVFTTPLTITANDQTEVYGAPLPTLTASYTGFINGDTFATLATPPNLTTVSAGSPVSGSPYAITASGAVDPYYTFTYIPGSLTVTKANLVITANNQSKVYGAVLPGLTARYTGLVNSDTPSSLTPEPNLTTNASATSVVGNYTITVGGAIDGNYSISYVPGSLTVIQAPLTITADDHSKVYGAELPGLTASYTGLVNSDTSSSLIPGPTLTTTASTTSDVGNYAITASGAVDPNYSISYVPGLLTVTQAPLTITADDQSKVYGAVLPGLTASYTGFVNSDTPSSLISGPTLTTTASATSDVGTYDITASGAIDNNYSISYVPGSLTVSTANLVITANDQSKVYGADLPGLTASYTGLVNGDTVANLTTMPTLTTTASATSDVGTYAITASGAIDGNYSISYVPGSLTVTQAPLTITADDQSKLSGADLPGLTASYTGFVNGDTVVNLTTLPTLTTTATASSVVGTYAITASGAVDPNYSISYADGTLTVVPTAITGTVYLDLNANGVLDSGEPGLAGRVVFLDLNHDSTLDAGDPTATTDAVGHYTLTNSSTGAIVVLEATSQDTSDRYVVDQSATNTDGTVTIGVVPYSPIAPVAVVPSPFSSTPSTDANMAFVNSLYLAVLGRTGGVSEVDTWLVRMNAGMTDQEVTVGFVNSPEHRQNEVISYYEDFLHRAPDPTSVVWVNDLMNGVSEETVVEDFLNSPEYQAAHQDSNLFIDDLYLDVLGRNGESTGVATWQAALASGTTRETVVSDFVESLEADDQIVQGFYSAFLRRQREDGTSSDLWVNMLEAPNGSATDVAVDILASPEFDQDAKTSIATV